MGSARVRKEMVCSMSARLSEMVAGRDCPGGEVTKPAAVIFNWQIESIAHEFDVTMDGLGADFEFAGERGGIGTFSGLQRLMDSQHPLQRWPGMRPCVWFRARLHAR